MLIVRKWGRKVPLPLPPSKMLTRTVPTSYPTVIDLRSWDGPIKDQGQEGSCTGHAFSSSFEFIYRKYASIWLPKGQATNPIFSPQYLYSRELIMDGNFPNDDGSSGETGCNISTQFGCCLTSLYPYVAGQINQPTPAQDANARIWMMGAYHGLTGSATAISVLADPVPWPVQVGFTVYASFESEAVASTGIYNPQPGEKVVGGHEVKLSGFDVGSSPTLRPANCPPAALVQNSWGLGWGWKSSGYFWMPLSVLDAADTDLKIIHSGQPWRVTS